MLADNLHATPIIVKYFKEKGLSDLVVVSPDAGGVKRLRALAKLLNVPLAVIDTRRVKHNEVAEVNVIGGVAGKTCVLIDDMIDTGGTICAAADALVEKGAKGVCISASHGIFSGPALERLSRPSVSEVVVTDSICHENLLESVTVVSVSRYLGSAIKGMQQRKSLGDLIDETSRVL